MIINIINDSKLITFNHHILNNKNAASPRMVYFLETEKKHNSEEEEVVHHEPPSHESCDSIIHSLKPSLKCSKFRSSSVPLLRIDTPDPHHA